MTQPHHTKDNSESAPDTSVTLNIEAFASGEAGILLVAHGSRVESSNQEIQILADKLRSHLTINSGNVEPVVEHAFLELAEPSITDAIDKCAGYGISQLRVLPYFLAAGRHVRDDIPEEIDQGIRKYPQMNISVASHVGTSDMMLELLLNMSTS